MKNIYDLKEVEVNRLIAKAVGIPLERLGKTEIYCVKHGCYLIGAMPSERYLPTELGHHFVPLLELYRPYITPLNDVISVEIVGNTTPVKTERSPDYVAVKAKTIRYAVCLAIVAYHFGYEVDVDNLLVYEND